MYDLDIPRARDTMLQPTLVLAAETDLLEAIDQLAAKKASAAPVLDEHRCLLGMLTEKDCLRLLTAAAFDRPRIGPVSEYMSKISVQIEPEMDLFRVAELFLGTNFPMLPVVSNGKLVGCVTRQQMLNKIQTLGRQLDAQQSRIATEAASATSRPRSIEKMQQTAASHSPEQLARKLGRT